MKLRVAHIVVFFLLLSTMVQAQRDTSIVIESQAKSKQTSFWKKDYPDPKKATLMSVVVPGLGQVYNKHWWKAGIIYGAGGALVYAIDFNTDRYKAYKTAYRLRVDGDPDTDDEVFTFLTDAGVKSRRDYFDKNRQVSYVGLVFIYVLNVVDAFASSHLNSFELSDDLSSILPLLPDYSLVDISYSISLGKKKNKQQIVPINF